MTCGRPSSGCGERGTRGPTALSPPWQRAAHAARTTHLVAFLTELVGAQDVGHVVDLAEALHDAATKGEACPPAGGRRGAARSRPVPGDAERPCLRHGLERARAPPSHLSDRAKSSRSGCGSDHMRSASGPSVGISVAQARPRARAPPAPRLSSCSRSGCGDGPRARTLKAVKHPDLVDGLQRRRQA